MVDSLEIKNTTINLSKDLHVSHILIGFNGCRLPVPVERSKKEASVFSLEIYERLKKGGLFVDLAKEYSDDPSVSKNLGELGWLSWGQTVKAFQNVAFC